MAYLASPTPSCSLVFSRVFGCFPPHPTTCCVTITHLFASHQQPTASPTASHHRGSPHQHASLASPSREATRSAATTSTHTLEHSTSPPQHHKSRPPAGNPDDRDDGQQPHQHP